MGLFIRDVSADIFAAIALFSFICVAIVGWIFKTGIMLRS